MYGLEEAVLTAPDLTLRLLTREHWPALLELLQNTAVTEPAGFTPPETDEEREAFFRHLTQYENTHAVLLGNKVIGYIIVTPYQAEPGSPYEHTRNLELGYVLGKPYQHQGYGTQMLKAMTDYLKGQCDYCFAGHFDENEACGALLKKCGYVQWDEYNYYFDKLEKEKHIIEYVI